MGAESKEAWGYLIFQTEWMLSAKSSGNLQVRRFHEFVLLLVNIGA